MRLEFMDQSCCARFEEPPLAVVVDAGVPQQPIEPGDDRLLIAQGAALFDSLDEGRLQNILGYFRRPNATLDKGEELPAAFKQTSERLARELSGPFSCLIPASLPPVFSPTGLRSNAPGQVR